MAIKRGGVALMTAGGGEGFGRRQVGKPPDRVGKGADALQAAGEGAK